MLTRSRKRDEPVKMEDLLKTNEKVEVKEVNSDKNEKVEVNSDKNIVKSNKIKEKNIIEVPKGKPKSGRHWKSERKRFSSIVKVKGVKNSFEKKQALRIELKRVKEASRALLAAKEEEKQRLKERRRENIKRQEESRKKSEVVQVIKDTRKIKKMRKKQLRFIEKRDTN